MNIVTEARQRALFVTNSGNFAPISPTPLAQNGIRHPNEHVLHVELQSIVNTINTNNTPENTLKAMTPKIQEYFEFCEALYNHDPNPSHLNFEKVYRFMYYVAFREKRKQGGRRSRGVRGIVPKFDMEEYKRVTNGLQALGSGSNPINAPQTREPISEATFMSYKAAIKSIYKEQIARQQTSLNFDAIWQQSLDELVKHVKTRLPKQRKAFYHEKFDNEFANYTMVDHYGDIEEELWRLCHDSSTDRSSFANLRNRYQFLHLTSGVLRAETLYKAELSDFWGVWSQDKNYDIHRMYKMVNKITEGKTNHGRVLYGRVTRHTDVRLCVIGALAFYLQYRFYMTREMESLTLEDWLDNSKWFDIKLLVDATVSVPDNNIMSNHSFAKKLGEVLVKLQLSSEKILHLGRKLGPKILELLNETSEDIRRMGNWNPSIFDKCYSTKLPQGPIKKLAGFHGSNSRYYLPRSQVEPPEQLLTATPIGTWVYNRLAGVRQVHFQSRRAKHQTALHSLLFFQELNKIYLQDAAAMTVLHPDRREQMMFRNIGVFATVEWTLFCEQMRHSLQTQMNPADVGLETVMPGVHQRFRSIESMQNRQVEATNQLNAALTEGLLSVSEGLKGLEERAMEREEATRRRLLQAILQAYLPHSAARSTVHGSNVVQRTNAPTDGGLDELARLMDATDGEDGVGNFSQQRNGSSPTNNQFQSTQQLAEAEIYNLRLRHQSLLSLYNEWYGLGEFDDGKGGIPGRDRRFGCKWRTGQIHCKKYSRLKQVVETVDQLALARGITPREAINHLEPLFKEAKGTLSGMLKRLEANGYRTKGNSRKRRLDQIQAESV